MPQLNKNSNRRILDTRSFALWGLCALICLSFSLAKSTGYLEWIDNAVYDSVYRSTHSLQDVPDFVTSIKIEPGHGKAELTERLARYVRHSIENGAHSIAILFPKSDLEIENVSDFPPSMVVFADEPSNRERLKNIDKKDFPNPHRWQTSPVGCVVRFEDSDGVCRRHFGNVGNPSDPSTSKLTIQQTVAKQVEINEFRINFRGGVSSLPELTESDIARGAIVPQLFEGKVVVIGRAQSDSTNSVYTPLAMRSSVANSVRGLSNLELQAQAMNCLLGQRQIVELNTEYGIGILVVAGFGLCWFFYRLSRFDAVTLLLITCSTTIAVSAYFLVQHHLWLACGELLALQGTTFLMVTLARHKQLTQLAASTAQQMAIQSGLRSSPEDGDSDDLESVVWNTIDQFCSIDRAAILFNSRLSRQLKRSATFHNCQSDDLAELNDLKVLPEFLDAKETSQFKVVAETGSVWRNPGPQLKTIILHLEDVGRSAGMLILETETIPKYSLQQLEKSAARAILRFENSIAGQHRFLGQYLTASPVEVKELDEVGVLSHWQQQKLKRFETLFEVDSNPKSVFALCGNPVSTNRKMKELLKSQNVLPTTRLVETLTLLSARDEEQVRAWVVNSLESTAGVSHAIEFSGNQKYYELRLRAIELEPASLFELNGAAIGLATGISVELVETTELQNAIRVQKDFGGSLSGEIRNDLASLDLIASLITSAEANEEQRDHFCGLIRQNVKRAVATLEAHDRHEPDFDQPAQTRQGSSNLVGYTPILIAQPIEEAVELFNIGATDSVKAVLNSDERKIYALASQTILTSIISTCLKLANADARDDSSIHINCDSDPHESNIMIKSDGFGILGDVSMDIGDTSQKQERSNIPELIHLYDQCVSVTQWGGSMTLTSQLGEGICITIRLRRFA